MDHPFDPALNQSDVAGQPGPPSGPELVHVVESRECCDSAWEEAYARFETPEQEIQKFRRRLAKLGADRWPRDAEILEIFCGRGNGLHALNQLGFDRLEGADLSASLLARYRGPGKLFVCDCRQMHFEPDSKDFVIVQGGLHHLERLPEDLEATVSEAHRVLRQDGRMVVVEPWRTPFLDAVHFLSSKRLIRRLSAKFDAFETMYEHERETYDQWLGAPRQILTVLEEYFDTEKCTVGWGKLMFVGRKSTRGFNPG